MEVILIRHAKAGVRDPNSWPDDDDRPLTSQGRSEQRAAARAMKKMGIKFDFLVTSPLARAGQTAEIVAAVYGWVEPPQQADQLGHGCSVPAVIRLLAKFPPDARVALVGHEPDFSSLAAALISHSGHVGITLKKSGVVGIEFDGAAEAGAGTLMYHLKPSQLRAVGR